MAFDPSYGLGGFGGSSSIPDFSADLPIFNVEHVQLRFEIASKFVAVQVSNDFILLGLASGRLLRIDLNNPLEVDGKALYAGRVLCLYMHSLPVTLDILRPCTNSEPDFELPKKLSEVGTIRKLFLDPTASHLLINTTNGENFYLHSRATKARHLSRLKNAFVDCVAWSPAQPTTSTREILLGTREGAVYEIYIESSEEFMRRDERYVKQVYRTPDGQPITGIHMDILPGQSDLRRVLLTTSTKILHFVGKVSKHGHDIAPIFHKFFEAEAPSRMILFKLKLT